MTKTDMQRENILQALLTSKDITEASKKANVSRNTIYKYLKEDEFIEAYRALKRAQIHDLANKIHTGADKSIDCLINMLSDKGVSANIKISATKQLIDVFKIISEIELNIDQKVIEENDVFNII